MKDHPGFLVIAWFSAMAKKKEASSIMATKPLCPHSLCFKTNAHAYESKPKFSTSSDSTTINATKPNFGNGKRKDSVVDLEEISTELTLYNGFCNNIKKQRKLTSNNSFLTPAMKRIASFRDLSREEEEEERRMGVSTRLSLYDDPWKIKKNLTESDLNGLSRLLLRKEPVQIHILAMLGPVHAKEIEMSDGVGVTVWDYDTESEHELTLKRWPATKSYVLINGWRHKFVNRRELKQGDEIGLFWDPYKSRLGFRVLDRAP